MNFRYSRSYCGPVKSVIFDWAGTTVDYGCFAPTMVFLDLFKRFGVEISVAEARAPMGGHKRDHLREILMMDSVAGRWAAVHGALPTEAEVDKLFEQFIPAQIEAVKHHADIIPGCLETCAWLREQDIRIGSTTGYSSDIMAPLTALAAQAGFAPDHVVCADQVPQGRPAPWMCFDNARHFGLYPMESAVKVGDTVPDILEGLNAGMWTVGLVVTGNEMGLREDEVNALSESEYQRRRDAAAARLIQAGAHYVADGIADLPPIIEEITDRLDIGEKP